MKIIICDIDGTLCDISQRLHLIKGNKKKDWDAFFAEIPNDKPRLDIIEEVRHLKLSYRVVLVSGRPERFREQTEQWLLKHLIAYNGLLMRKNGDYRPDDIVKQEILDEYFNKDDIELVIDDRPRVIRMWQKNGLKVMDVGKGVEF